MRFHVEDIGRYEEVKHDADALRDRPENSIHDTSASESTRSEPIPLEGEAVLDASNRRPGATKIGLSNVDRSKCKYMHKSGSADRLTLAIATAHLGARSLSSQKAQKMKFILNALVILFALAATASGESDPSPTPLCL